MMKLNLRDHMECVITHGGNHNYPLKSQHQCDDNNQKSCHRIILTHQINNYACGINH